MESSPVTIHVNPEHGGLRLAVLLSLFAGAFLGFILIRAILGWLNDGFPDYTLLVSCLGSILIAMVTVWVVEQILKRVWHSGQRLELNEEGVTLVNKTDKDIDIQWQGDVTCRHWTFKLSGFNRAARESRLPKNWVCLATMVQKDDKRIVVFSYMSPDKAAPLLDGTLGNLEYHTIDPLDVYDSSIRIRMGPAFRPEIPAAVLTGSNGRYWLAEKRRWENGLELDPDDYKTFINFLSQHVVEALP